MMWVRRGAQFTAGALIAVLAVLLLYAVRSVLAIVLLAVLLAEAIAPLVVWLRERGAHRAQAVLVIYTGLACALSLLLWLLAGALAQELGELATNLPQIQGELTGVINAIPVPQLRDAIARSIEASSSHPLSLADGVPGALQTGVSLLQAVFGVVSILVIAFYWTVEHRTIRGGLLGLLPPNDQARGREIWDDVERKIGAWVRGQLLLMLAIGATFAVGLALMGVRYALLLGVVAGCAEILPVVGPWIGTTPAVAIALTQSLPLGLLVLGFGVAVQLFETNVLLPRLLGHATGISPLVVFVSILIGAELMGVMGALLAVPVAAGIQVLLEKLRAPVVLPGAGDEPVDRREAA